MQTKNILTMGELRSEEFFSILKISRYLKQNADHGSVLCGKSLVMIFQKPSTRTRISFEVGMYQLGGQALNLSASEMQLSRGESIEDTARTISRYADCVMARVYEHSHIEALASSASIPVINGLSNTFHPCQTLADFATIAQHKGDLKKLRIAWVGDGNNVCNSMIYGAALAGVPITIATPEEMQPLKQVVQQAQKHITIQLTTDPVEAVRDADVVMTDTFKSIHTNTDSGVDRLYPTYQVNDSLMRIADSDAIFLHCLPATRGREVTKSVMDGPQSVVWDEAENRLHTQKALLIMLMRPDAAEHILQSTDQF